MERKFKNALLPTVLGITLTALLWMAPERYAMWLWGWAAVMMFPQPRLLALIHGLLAASCVWRVSQNLGTEQALLIAILLVSLMLLGLALEFDLRAQWRNVTQRARLSHGSKFWPGHRLLHDLSLETTRCEREGSHGELMLLRCSIAYQQAMITTLSGEARRFERCYQIDARTFAVLLIHRNVTEASLRHTRLIENLPKPYQLRFIALDPALSLPSQLSALGDQIPTVVIAKEAF